MFLFLAVLTEAAFEVLVAVVVFAGMVVVFLEVVVVFTGMAVVVLEVVVVFSGMAVVFLEVVVVVFKVAVLFVFGTFKLLNIILSVPFALVEL